MEFDNCHGAPGFVTPFDSQTMSAAVRAIEIGFGRPPVFIREGGSIPIVTAFSEKLGVYTLSLQTRRSGVIVGGRAVSN